MSSTAGSRKAFPDWLLGVSFAATWTWAVSVLVGMALLREQGVIPFLVWFAANTAAIPVFGFVSRRYPQLWDQTRRLPMRAIMTVMLVFTFWINLTGVMTIGTDFDWLTQDQARALALATGFLMWLAVAKAGIRWSVISDRVQWWALYGSAIVALALTLAEKGLVIDPTLKLGTYETPRDWMLGLYTIPLLLSNPFIDATFWHRAAYAKSFRPYGWGFAMFFSYLCMVAALGFIGATPAATILLYVVIFFAANSTMDSTASALHLTAGRKLGIGLGLVMLALWLPVSNLGLLDAWLALFSWFPLIFIWQVVTYILQRRGVLRPPSRETLQARDAVPLIYDEQEAANVTA